MLLSRKHLFLRRPAQSCTPTMPNIKKTKKHSRRTLPNIGRVSRSRVTSILIPVQTKEQREIKKKTYAFATIRVLRISNIIMKSDIFICQYISAFFFLAVSSSHLPNLSGTYRLFLVEIINLMKMLGHLKHLQALARNDFSYRWCTIFNTNLLSRIVDKVKKKVLQRS